MLRGEFFGMLAAAGASASSPELEATAAPSNPDLDAAATPARLQRLRAIRSAAAARVPRHGAVHRSNGDDARYADRYYLGSYTKGLPHDERGRVDPAAYRIYLAALGGGSLDALRRVAAAPVFGLVAATRDLAYEYEGDDATQFVLPAPGTVASAATARDMIEDYWMARARDVPFARFSDDATIAAACAELGTKPDHAFRGGKGTLRGPYISQFLYLDLVREPAPPQAHTAQFAVAGRDYLTTRETLIEMQRHPTEPPAERESQPRYIFTLRALADYISRYADVIGNTAAILSALPPGAQRPYFDAIEMSALAARAQAIAGSAVYFQKFMVHRRVRPEMFGLLVDRARTGEAIPIHASVLHSAALEATLKANGNALLPQAYTYGCPMHPSFPAAHGIISGANITIFKAFIDDEVLLPRVIAANADGSKLIEQTDSGLTLGDELDKLAANYAFGRCAAGVHFRADCEAGLRLGEAAALSVLRDRMQGAPAGHGPFVVRTFDGTRRHIA
jgi:hypothetical protein